MKGSQNGKTYEWEYTAFYDGQPHEVIGRDDVDAIVIYRLDEHSTAGFFQNGAMPGGPYKRTTSRDGQTLTEEAAGRHTDGTPFYDVIVYAL